MKKIHWQQQSVAQKKQILKRPIFDQATLLNDSKKIIDTVKRQGDEAVINLTQQYDQVQLSKLAVTVSEIKQAKQQIDSNIQKDIEMAISRLYAYQSSCLPNTQTFDSQDGIICQKIFRPISAVGLYVPGGSAPLISTLMMLAIPAVLAQCNTIVLCTPPNQDATLCCEMLVTASLCGIDKIYKVGGAQAIAAMAYGTREIPKVDKIYGPGNAWVTAAKQIVSQDPAGADIDMPAGPSELLVIADKDADASFVAADLLSQAEHGPDSQVILITDSPALAMHIEKELASQLNALPRKAIAMRALAHSTLIMVSDLKEAFSISNTYAPEHLSLQLKEARHYLPLVDHAGAVFLGYYTPETMGDYINGANHVLPTYGYANRMSGLSVVDFMHALSVQQVTESGLQRFGPAAMTLAAIEGLDAHKRAVEKRLQTLVEA